MALTVCVLGSGSRGNCTYVGSDTTRVLVDAGLSCKETNRRLGEIGVALPMIDAVCISHEHRDHTVGLRVMHTRYGIPLYANMGTVEGIQRDARLRDLPWNVFTTGTCFHIGDLLFEPFSVPHDAYDPVGFTAQVEQTRAAVVTDMGVPTTLIRQHLKMCRAIVLEANHDEGMLQDAERPWHLKQRILGRQGHLSNQSAARMLSEVAHPGLDQVFLAHISDECNTEELAVRTARDCLAESGYGHVNVSATFPDRISELWCC